MASGGAVRLLTYDFHYFIGRSINVKSAGLVGRHGPQSKQPFMVAFFKASEVLFRSVRAANNKRKNQNRNKSSSHQESSRMPSVGGKMKLWFTILFRGVMGTCSNAVKSQQLNKMLLIGWTVRNCAPAPFLPASSPALLKPLLLWRPWAWSTFSESSHLHVSRAPGWWNA